MIGPDLPNDTPKETPLKTLRQFAGLCLLIFGALFALSWYRHQGQPTVFGWIALAIAILVGVPGLIYPAYVRPIFMGAMAVTAPIGHVISILLLGLIYFGLLTPIAFVFRLFKRDALSRTRREVESYWVAKPQQADVRTYLRQYHQQ